MKPIDCDADGLFACSLFQQDWLAITIEEHMATYEDEGMSRKDAMKAVAKDRGSSKREVYQYLLKNDQI